MKPVFSFLFSIFFYVIRRSTIDHQHISFLSDISLLPETSESESVVIEPRTVKVVESL